MINFKAHELVAALRSVLYWANLSDYMRSQGRGGDPFNEESYRLLLTNIATLRDVSLQAGLGSAAQTLGLILQRIEYTRNKNCEAAYLAGELVNAYDAVLDGVIKHRFLRVRLLRHVCIDNPNLMGPEVLKAFPSAKPDIIEAGNCLAADCNTAADQEFYYPILQDVRGLRDAWRNHVMHTRREYNHDEADAVFSHVRRLMFTLSGRVSAP